MLSVNRAVYGHRGRRICRVAAHQQALRKALWVQAGKGRYKLSRKQVLVDDGEEQPLQVGYIARCQAPSNRTDMDLGRKATHLAQIKPDKGDRLGSPHIS